MYVIEFETKTAKYRKKAIIKAVEYAFLELMPRVRNPVYINIRAIRKLAEKQGVYGDCMDEGDREFTIRIDVSLPLKEMIATILHEMVHVQQYLTKRMTQTSSGEVRFEKDSYFVDMPYDDRPWEIEAHAKEKQLTEGYFESIR